MRKRSPIVVVSFLLITALAALGAEDGIENNIPAEAPGVVIIEKPYRQFRRFLGSDVFARLTDPETVPAVAHGVENVRRVIQAVETQHGTDAGLVMGGIFRREAALVALPGDRGVLISRGENAHVLRSEVKEFLRVERATGNLLSTETFSHRGVTINTCSLGNQPEPRHHALVGDRLVLSEDLEAVKQVIDVTKGEAPSLAESVDFKHAMGQVEEGAILTAYLSAGAVANAIDRKAGATDAGGRTVLRRVREAVGRARYAVLWAKSDAVIEGRLTVQYGEQGIPPLLRTTVAEPGTDLSAPRFVPGNAAFTLARSLNPAACWREIVGFLQEVNPPAAQKAERGLRKLVQLIGGVDSADQLFSELGNEVALFVLSGADAQNPPRVGLVLALNETAHIPVALETFVGTAAVFAAVEGKADVSLVHAEVGGVRVTTVRVRKPSPWDRLSPSMAVVRGHLVVTSTRDAMREVIAAAGSRPEKLAGVSGTSYALIQLDATRIEAMLQRHNEFLVRRAVEEDGKPEPQARRELRMLRLVLSLMEEIEVINSYSPDRTEHAFRITFPEE